MSVARALFLWFLLACDQRFVVPPPPASPDINTLLVVAFEPAKTSFHPADLRSVATIEFEANPEAEIFALGYVESAEELQLPTAPTDGGRPLPEFEIAHLLTYRDGLFAWSSLPEMDPRIRGLHIPDYDFARCAMSGGCLAVATDDYCTIPCGEPPAPDPPMTFDVLRQPSLIECDPLLAQFLGEADCSPIGRACTEWPDPSPNMLYVREGANGDGSTPSSPLGRIADAMNLAGAGSVIAIRGTFDEQVRLKAGVTLAGACVEESVISWSGASPALIPLGRGGALRDLQVESSSIAISIGTDAEIDLEGVLLHGASIGVRVHEGSLTGRDVVIRGAAMREIDLILGARADLSRAVLEAGHGIRAVQAELTLSDSVIRNVDGARLRRNAALFAEQSRLTLQRSRVAQSNVGGVYVHASEATIADVLVDVTDEGVRVDQGGSATIDRSLVDTAAARAIVVTSGATATVTDSLVKSSTFDTTVERAVSCDNAELVVRRIAVENSGAVALGADDGCHLIVEDAVLRGTSDVAIESTTARIDVLRASLEVVGVGLRSASDGSIAATHLTIRGGNGMLAAGGLITADHFDVEVTGIGLTVASEPGATLSQGRISSDASAVTVPLSFDLRRILDRVLVHGPVDRVP